MPKRGLGRGLDALIPGGELAEGQPVLQLRPDEIEPSPFQPRTAVTDESIRELVESVRTHGIIQPLLVRPTGDGYQLVAGERRWRAASAAGLSTVPCLVQDVSDERALQLGLVENLQREDLTPIEAARGYRRLIDEFGMTQADLAVVLGRSRATITNTLRLLNLPQEMQLSLQHGAITEGHARALMAMEDEQEMFATWKRVIERRLSVRETEQLVRRKLSPTRKRAAAAAQPTGDRDTHTEELEQTLQRALGTKAQIRPRADGGGTVTIEYYDPDDLENLVRTLELAARIV
ncbi:MAG: ParB/RepB/Spo0J family partition protein [Armatimonadota bacterium]